MDILILAHSRWEGKYSSTILSLAKVFARDHRVFYLGNPYTIREVIRGIFNPQIWKLLPALFFGWNNSSRPVPGLPNFIVITPLVTWSINWLPINSRLFRFMSRVNDRRVFRVVKKAMRHFNIKNFTYINSYNPLYGNSFPTSFKPNKKIYHSVDDITKSPYVSKHGTGMEKEAVGKADQVVTTSRQLARLRSSENANTYVVPNAADVRLFQEAALKELPIPHEIKEMGTEQKIIGYVGNICHRLDYDLLIKIADDLPDHILLMVGPISSDTYKKSGLNRRPNVVFTGRKKLEELPAYLKYVHCCIIPFLCNELTKSIYPLKVNEYLSAGKPVVSTPFSEEIREFEGTIDVRSDHSQFIDSIRDSIVTDDTYKRDKRVEISAMNSWENRAKNFMQIINQNVEWKAEQNHLTQKERRKQISGLQ
ncbi:MAG: glycosyltransferase [Marinoscillum sp.]